MIYALLGLIIGVFAGFYFEFDFPSEYIRYTAVIILGIIDSLIGAWKAEVRGKFHKDKYNPLIFLTGISTNIIFACLITFLGEHLGLDLYLAVTVVFTIRIFTNLGKIRREILDCYLKKKNEELIKIEFL